MIIPEFQAAHPNSKGILGDVCHDSAHEEAAAKVILGSGSEENRPYTSRQGGKVIYVQTIFLYIGAPLASDSRG